MNDVSDRVRLDFKTHRLGLNCGSAPFRDVLEYCGFRFSEEAIFGIGSGLNLAYHHGDELVPDPHWRAPLTIITGRSIAPYEEAASVLGVQLYTDYNTSDEQAAFDLQYYVARGMPVVCEVDQEEMLHRFGAENPLTKRFGFRFGGHKTIVIGYDRQAGTATVLENMFPQTFDIPLDVLGRMRSSREALYPPRNHRFVVSAPPKLQRTEQAIKFGIAKNVQRMRHPDYRGNGLAAVDWMADELCGWPDLLARERLDASILMAWLQSERLSGGGMYRNIYARFLRQADDLLPHPQLVAAAKTYRSLARLWSSVIAQMMGALESRGYRCFSSPSFRADVEAIRAGEHRGIEMLEEVVASWS